MEIKVTLENYKDIQEFKNAMNTTCDKMVKDLRSTFNTKQVDILNQIDGYLKGIALQLKGTKMYNGARWVFQDNDKYQDSNGKYPSTIRVYIEDDGNYYLEVKLFSNFSGEHYRRINIYDGDIEMPKPTEWNNSDFNIWLKYVRENKQFFIETLIKSWKELKKSINDTIMIDLENSQRANNNKINTMVSRNAIYDNFEL